MLATGEFITEVDLEGVMDSSAPEPLPVAAPRAELPAPLVEIEREHIIKTLEQVRGNKAVAARLLGISRRAFYRQLERHGLHQRVPMGSREAEPLEQARHVEAPEERRRAS
jgi:DNA-binding NtrC family response regulator